MQVLRSLGVAIADPAEAASRLDEERRRSWRRLVAPCAVAWDGHEVDLVLRVPTDCHGDYRVELTLESGEQRLHEGRIEHLQQTGDMQVASERWSQRALRVPVGHLGYHQATVHADGRQGRCHVISAPTTGYRLPPGRRFGLFTPLYALRHQGGGAGDLGDLTRLARWAHGVGGEHRGASFIGTLPLLAAFLDEPFEPSPYSPVSRLFWNELYLDLTTAPALDASERARELLGSQSYRDRARSLDALELVDYRQQMAHKREVLAALAEAAFASDRVRADIDAFIARQPRVEDYARFRAVTAARGQVWSQWPEAMRDGQLAPEEYDLADVRYHIYAQYAMDAQLARLGERDTATLYLDVPVGVNRGGYDVWRDREAFVLPAAAGAPPDALFSSGQNWGLPPLHPRRMRERGYRYFIDTIRHHVRHAGLVRIDHAMGLHRLYWIPDGVATRDGVYVYYPAGEMYAVISLESHRHQCAITGEDLGTVPDYVRPSMQHHGLSRLYVAQFSLPDGADVVDGRSDIEAPPAQSVASLNTHDLPTFHGFFHGRDIDNFHELGLLDVAEAADARKAREATCRRTAAKLVEYGFLAEEHRAGEADSLAAIARALQEYLAASSAEMLMIALEDLWLAPLAHNVPGTTHERPNWRRRMERSVEDITGDPGIASFLQAIARLRS